MVVNNFLVNTRCDITFVLNYELYNNQLVFTLRKVFMCEVLKEKCRVPS